jgi:hypothetical protein
MSSSQLTIFFSEGFKPPTSKLFCLPPKKTAMLQVTVSLPSGSGATLLLPEDSTVGDLKLLAQRSLKQGFLRIATAEGRVLTNSDDSLRPGETRGMRLSFFHTMGNC